MNITSELQQFPALVMSRMSSSRLPGKALREINEKPLVAWVFDALMQCSAIGDVVLATSTDPSDDPLAEFAEGYGLQCFRGDLQNASLRFLNAMEHLGAAAAFRVNGDSPFVSLELLRRAATRYSKGDVDLVSNIFPRTYPPGMSVELVGRDAYARAYGGMSDPSDFEHVTRYLYQNHTEFRIANLTSDTPYDHIHLAVDTLEDWQAMEKMISSFSRAHWDHSVEEILAKCHQAKS